MNSQNLERSPETGQKRGSEKTSARELTPAVDVYENEHELVIVADLPE